MCLVIILIAIIVGLLALVLWLWMRIQDMTRDYEILKGTVSTMVALTSEPNESEGWRIVGAARNVLESTAYGMVVKGMLPPADQGDCNACWAISTCQAVSDRLHLEGKILGDQLNYYAYHDIITARTPDNDGCQYGANLQTGLERFVTDGAPLMSQSKDRTFDGAFIKSDTQAKSIKVKGWRQLTVYDSYGGTNMSATISAMKRDLQTKGTLVGVINLFDSFNYFAGPGVYRPSSTESTDESMAHMISVVGYDDRDNTWILRNSYNTSWGYNGFVKVPQGDRKIDLESYIYAADI